MKPARLAIFASGLGSNAEKIIQYFKDHPKIEVALVCSNKATAGVLDIARRENVEVLCFDRSMFYQSEELIHELQNKKISHIVLAGFLWLIPPTLIKAFPDRIINIHPALLPKYGGKGMYGDHVHKAVKEAEEKETGITIHLVNENYDEGKTILEKKTGLMGSESVAEIASKVHALEYEYYPSTIEKWVIGAS